MAPSLLPGIHMKNFIALSLNIIYFTMFDNLPNISLDGTDGGASVILLWAETKVPGIHKPSHVPKPRIEPGSQLLLYC